VTVVSLMSFAASKVAKRLPALVPTGRPLVVGIGNALRGDDALGCYVAELVAADRRFSDVDVLSVHQLTPDLAAEFAAASRVVVVDAAADGASPGTVHVLDVSAASGPGSTDSFTHHVDVATLMALARELYAATPPAFVVTVSAASLDFDAPLSESVGAAIDAVLETIAALSLEDGHA
jgi:hydrogenase maturation protease